MLLTDPSLLTQVRDEGDRLLDRFVEEVLRLNGSVQFRPRRASDETIVGGKTIQQGDMLTVEIIGANRAEAHYGCPHAVDLERSRQTGSASCRASVCQYGYISVLTVSLHQNKQKK